MENEKIHGYTHILQVDKVWVKTLFDDEIVIQEKIDGSQISFRKVNDELQIRSKNAIIYVDNPPKMFKLAVDTIVSLKPLLKDGWTYRGEYLSKPKHNSLKYDRVPKKNIVLFDVDMGDQLYMNPFVLKNEADALGLECVRLIYIGRTDREAFDTDLNVILNVKSMLGGVNMEGIVVKNYSRSTPDGKAMMGKFVSEQFKEVHNKAWKKSNPGTNDIIKNIIEMFGTEARWIKAVQHLRDDGILTQSPKDIGGLMKEVKEDIEKECEEQIKDVLFKHFWGNISRGVTSGLPEWYKEKIDGNV